MDNSKNNRIHEAILEVLVRDWDPSRLQAKVIKGSHFERYVAPIHQILTGTRSEKDLAGYLRFIKSRDFGILDFPRHRNHTAARKLLEIKMPGDEPSGRGD